MGRAARLVSAVLIVSSLAGCVERRMLIVSDPPGATAVVNGQNIGPTPASMPFTYYGKYDVTLVRDGYQTKTYCAQIHRPWFEFYPIDFFAENVWPTQVHDNRTLQFSMQPLIQPRSDEVVNDANALRQRANAVQQAPPDR
jgi:PEGA domain-containing protein